MNEPFSRIDWWKPQVGQKEQELLHQVLDSNFLNDGEFTTRFEDKLADLLGCKHVVAVTSGTSALFLALIGNGIGRGDEVIVPDITFIATANAVVMSGAKPVLVDIDPNTLNLSPSEFKKAITPRTKAVIPVHVSGRPADMPTILKIAQDHGITVVEDAAEALLSKLNGRCLGTFGHLGILSFSPNKTITTGQGGAILTNNDELHIRLRELKDQGRPVRGTGGDDIHDKIGYNFKLTNLQASIGIAQLDKLMTRTNRMKQTYLQYVEGLRDVEKLTLLPFKTGRGEIPQWVDALTSHRNELIEYLETFNVHCRRFWFPIHTHSPYRLPDDNFTNSTCLASKAFWLPSSFSLTDADVNHVCHLIRKFFKNS